MSNVVNYYEEIYDEDKRLGEACDNRHKVEKIVKTQILEELVNKYNVKTIADIGAGTGLYSIYFAKKGIKVSAIDIVPKHIEIINKKAIDNNLTLDAFIGDALNVNLPSNSFDMVLLAGPLYHIHNIEDKLKALEEAKRIVKDNGIIVVDYLSDIHGYIQHILLDNNFLDKEIDFRNIDETFSYDNLERMKAFAIQLSLTFIDVFGTDGITRFIREDINKLDEIHLEKWINFIKFISNKKEIIDLSEHCLCVFQK